MEIIFTQVIAELTPAPKGGEPVVVAMRTIGDYLATTKPEAGTISFYVKGINYTLDIRAEAQGV